MIRANDGMTTVHAATQLGHLETVRVSHANGFAYTNHMKNTWYRCHIGSKKVIEPVAWGIP